MNFPEELVAEYEERSAEFRRRVVMADPEQATKRTASFMRYPGPGNRAERRALKAQARQYKAKR